MTPKRPLKGSEGFSPGRRKPKDRGKVKTIWTWPLPEDVRQALKGGLCEDNPLGLLKEISNPALLLQRYVPYPKRGQEGERLDQTLSNNATIWRWESDRGSSKNIAWQAIEEALHDLYQSHEHYYLAECLKNLHLRVDASMNALKSLGYICCSPISVKVLWRLVIGLGVPSPLDTGIVLHHVYGFPYLPGSAIKGVTRNWRLQQIADELKIPRLNAQQINHWKSGKHYGATPWERLEQLLMTPLPESFKDEKRRREIEKRIRQRYESLREALDGEYLKTLKELEALPDGDPELPPLETLKPYIQDFSSVFGNTESEGEILFFDAFPERLVTEDNKPILELDVMNPHYRDYYMGKKDARGNPIPPADWLSPVPVFFLAVSQGTHFIIRLASKDQNLMNKVESWVRKALGELGIGAKTRAGYGQMDTDLIPKGAKKLPNQPEAKPAAVSGLAIAIENWSPREMGLLPQIVSQLDSMSPDERRPLAQKLKEKLEKSGYWGGKYKEKAWHRQLEQML